MRERYPGIKIVRLSRAVYNLDFEREVIGAEEKLINEYGFLKEEINFIMRYNPKFILVDQQSEDGHGIKAMRKLLVQEKGFEMDSVRTLVVRYPYILSKTREELTKYFEILAG